MSFLHRHRQFLTEDGFFVNKYMLTNPLCKRMSWKKEISRDKKQDV